MRRLARASNMDCDCSDLSHCDAVALGTGECSSFISSWGLWAFGHLVMIYVFTVCLIYYYVNADVN